ncbi:MAG: UDP-3-O-[3-hydroxymyristoyl] N-acetylglucosamine deacetylase [Planctomycetes bacterium]|nr:UDP-3-O-[3-hydroxymyristoyl] N-acetylglucosamine deacetylase [Planctomycetota bacterium]
MNTQRNQRTISRAVSVEGFGYWSGRDVRVEFRPAEPNTGIVFVRTDLPQPVRIPATVKHRVETPRRTTLRANSTSVEMVEHVLAALSGVQIDNCEVRVNAPEMPGCDGSALPFVAALDTADPVFQPAPRAQLRVREVTRLGTDDCWIEAQPAATPGISIKFRIDYGRDNAIGRQTFSVSVTPETFRRDLAPARTFMLKEEADWLQSQGLGTRATSRDLLVFDKDGPIDNELRFRDECVRHKALDLVGDFALAGCDLIGQFVAHRSGHRLNAEMIRALLSEGELIGGWRRSA